jgi:hypothetical protein
MALFGQGNVRSCCVCEVQGAVGTLATHAIMQMLSTDAADIDLGYAEVQEHVEVLLRNEKELYMGGSVNGFGFPSSIDLQDEEVAWTCILQLQLQLSLAVDYACVCVCRRC